MTLLSDAIFQLWTGRSLPVAPLLCSNEMLHKRVASCIAEFAPTKAVTEAVTAAQGFAFPPAVYTRDAETFIHLGDSLEAVVAAQHESARHSRFNSQRCHSLLQDDPEYSVLLTMATHGVPIDVTQEFQPCRVPPPRRHLHTQLLNVYRSHAFQLWSAGHALLLPSALLSNTLLHYNPAHWTSKPGKPLGRFLCDCSNGVATSVLNSDHLKPSFSRRFGELHHPTISDIVSMIIHVSEREGGLHNLLLWKEDIAGAFSHFNYAANDAHLLAIQIDDEFTMVHTTGMFGWSGSPYAFGPISRALQRLVEKSIAGGVRVYVDDFMGVSHHKVAQDEQRICQEKITALLGSNAVNVLKSLPPARAADFIGWYIDLESASIRPNDRGIRKLTAVFFGHNFSKHVKHPIVIYQKLASLASRYSAALLAMRPFVHPFFALTSGKGPRACSSECRLAILVWRTVILSLLSNPGGFCVPLSAMCEPGVHSSWNIISDAGPHGLGVALYQGNSWNESGWYASYRLPFDASSPDYQNAREFLGLLYGLLLCIHANLNHTTITWYGDNKSSLAWVRKGRSSSRFAQLAYYALTWLCLHLNIEICSTVHVAGTLMGDIDSLSRFKPHSLSNARDASQYVLHNAEQLLRLCDPTQQHHDSVQSHLQSFCDVAHVISALFRV